MPVSTPISSTAGPAEGVSDFSGPAVGPQWRTHPGEFFKKSKEGVEMEGVCYIVSHRISEFICSSADGYLAYFCLLLKIMLL